MTRQARMVLYESDRDVRSLGQTAWENLLYVLKSMTYS